MLFFAAVFFVAWLRQPALDARPRAGGFEGKGDTIGVPRMPEARRAGSGRRTLPMQRLPGEQAAEQFRGQRHHTLDSAIEPPMLSLSEVRNMSEAFGCEAVRRRFQALPLLRPVCSKGAYVRSVSGKQTQPRVRSCEQQGA